MNKLIRDDAERFARACGWTIGYTETQELWMSPTSDPGIMERADISLDPDFWFPRLWDRLKTKYDGQFSLHSVSIGKHEACSVSIGQRDYDGNSPCLALCAAIEALEATDGQE